MTVQSKMGHLDDLDETDSKVNRSCQQGIQYIRTNKSLDRSGQTVCITVLRFTTQDRFTRGRCSIT